MKKNKRPEIYDWFKTGEEKPKSKKEKMKLLWKWLNIFGIFCLFVFSMTGCIQTFYIKTSNNITNGVEIFTSNKVISPNVITFQYKKKNVNYTEKTNNKNESKQVELFEVTKTPKSFYISHKNNEKLLTEINDVLKSQNNENPKNGSLTIKGSYRGYYEGVRIIGETSTNEKILKDDNQKPVILSSGSTYLHSKFKDLKNKITIPWIFFKDEEKDGKKIRVVDEKRKTVDVLFKDLKIGTKDNARQSYVKIIFNQLINKVIKKTNGNLITHADLKIKGINNNYVVNDQYSKNASQLMNSLGFTITKDKSTQTIKSFTWQENNFMSGKTDFIPIVTWNDAWKLGPFYGMFVYPIGFVSESLLGSMPLMNGWEAMFTIIIVVFSLRIIAFGATYKGTLQQVAMQEIQGKKAIIDAKYEAYKGNKQMEMRKNQEVQALYKKEGINPFSVFSTLFIQMPIFLAMWRIIGASQTLKTTVWLGINFSETSYKELFKGQWIYLPLMIVTTVFQLGSQMLPRYLNHRKNKHKLNIHHKDAMKKNNKIQNIMMIVFVFIGLTFSAGLQIYWIVGSVWTIIQTFITEKIKEKEKRRLKNKVSV